jgi:hypothetical protein
MKIISLLLLGLVLLAAGCESMSARVQERFATVEPHTHVYAESMKSVYGAAVQAVKNSGLLLGRKSFQDGRIEGYAPIRSGDETKDTRQTTIQVRVIEVGVGQTRVELLVFEHTEGAFPGGVSEQALRDHGLYETYFAALQQVLDGSVSKKPGENS